ncbi:unnamed protein product, partial [Trichogramma brassicae]
MEALRYHGVPSYLRRIVQDYLSDRRIVFPAREGWKESAMTRGVPQGSVLGPLLWNIGSGVGVFMPDDTLVTARGATYREASLVATAGVAQVVRRIRQLGLEVALQKSEALCFHGPRRGPPPDSSLTVGGVQIAIKSTMRYLGIVLDGRWNFGAHFAALVPRVMAAAGALTRLLPNIGGPEASCRRLYMGVVRSMALYGAPIWAEALSNQNIALLRRPQRVMAIRASRGYRTISCEAACVLAGSIPWDLEARTLASLFTWREEALARGHPPAGTKGDCGTRNELCQRSIEEWSRRLEQPTAG